MNKLILPSSPMTNSEYFEKNNVPFAVAMEIFNKQKSKKGGTKSFDKFLAAEHVKFKIGDLVVVQLSRRLIANGWKHNVVLKVVDVIDDNYYDVEPLTPDEDFIVVGDTLRFGRDFVDDNCILY